VTILLVLVSKGNQVRAQEGAFAFEIRGGAAWPTGSFRSGEGGWAGETTVGPSFTMGFTLPAPGPFGAFLGFGQRYFGCQDPICAGSAGWASTGFDVDLRLVLGQRRVRPWFKGGLHTHRVEVKVVEEGGEPTKLRSDGGAGYEVGGGILIAFGERTSLSPGVHFGAGEVRFPGRGALRIQYLGADLGLVLGF